MNGPLPRRGRENEKPPLMKETQTRRNIIGLLTVIVGVAVLLGGWSIRGGVGLGLVLLGVCMAGRGRFYLRFRSACLGLVRQFGACLKQMRPSVPADELKRENESLRHTMALLRKAEYDAKQAGLRCMEAEDRAVREQKLREQAERQSMAVSYIGRSGGLP